MIFFKKRDQDLKCPVDGQVIKMEEVPDAVFSHKMMGDGFAVEPSNGDVYSPFDAKVLSVFPTKHAICLVDKSGMEVLIHMGLDTVELKGEGFEVFVKEGDKVTTDTLLAKMNLDFIKSKEKGTMVIVALTSLKDKKIDVSYGKHIYKDSICKILNNN